MNKKEVTPEERARIIVESFKGWPAVDLECLRESIAEAIHAAVRAERDVWIEHE